MSHNAAGRILTFHSVHYALAAEAGLRGRGLEPDLIPVPVGISSDCGFCLFFPEGDSTALGRAAVLYESLTGIEGVWKVLVRDEGEGFRKEKRYEREN